MIVWRLYKLILSKILVTVNVTEQMLNKYLLLLIYWEVSTGNCLSTEKNSLCTQDGFAERGDAWTKDEELIAQSDG